MLGVHVSVIGKAHLRYVLAAAILTSAIRVFCLAGIKVSTRIESV